MCLHEDVYKPSDDTYLMLEYIKGGLTLKGSVALEVGCGSGILTAALLKAGAREVIALDVNPTACTCTLCTVKANFKEIPANLHVVCSDLISAFRSNLGFNIIIFNPPYLPCKPTNKLSLAWCGGEGGVEVACRFLDKLVKYNIAFDKLILILSTISNIKEFTNRCKGRFKIKISVKARFFFEQLVLIEVSK